jgi:cell division protein FtsB
VEPGPVSNRPHAHSKRKRSAEPRTFNASTGLTGVTEAELAYRAEITEAALDAAEASAAKAAKAAARSAKAAQAGEAIKSLRFKMPKASRDLEASPPRVFTLPAEPLPSPGTRAAPGTNAVAAEPAQPPEAQLPATPTTPRRTRTPDPAAPKPVTAKATRPLTARLTATAATEAAMAKARKVAKPDRADDPPSAEATTTDTATPATTPSSPRPSSKDTTAKPVPKASRAPKGGSRWRLRPPASAGEANRRPTDASRPGSAPPADVKARRFALPLVARKTEEAGQGSGAGASPRKHFARTSSATKGSAQQKPSKKKAAQQMPAKEKTPVTSQERRQRIPLVLAAIFAVAVLATSFPLSSLLSQHHQLSAAGAQLQEVQGVNRALAQQQHALDSNVAVNQLARGNYQMVTPGQTLYDVLPPSNKTGTTSPGLATSGDPGNQPLVAPANAPDLSPQPGLPQPIPMSAAGSANATTAAKSGTSTTSSAPIVPPAPTTFWGRVSDTLQFWK